MVGEELVAALINALKRAETQSTIETIKAPDVKTLIGIKENVAMVGASDELQISSDAEVAAGYDAYTKIKEFHIFKQGDIRAKFDIKTTNAAYAMLGKIYFNGAAVGTEQSTNSTSYVTFTEDFTIGQDDLIQLYVKRSDPSGGGHVANYRVYATIADTRVGAEKSV